ncbi:hypothetical protein BKH44_08275 [Helicobacter sp. 13S00477-4]|nr:hypothetical protein BKH44_08275 [Helicobacter sp. 13S00477-4]
MFSCYCKQYNIESFINLSHIDLSIKFAKEYHFEGVHIKSNQLNETKKITNLKTFYSAHQTQEILQAYQIGINFITISPIFATPNKPKPLGINYLQILQEELKKNLFALGGILTEKQIKSIKENGLKGFASIRYFLPK